MAARPWTDDDHARLVELHADGKSLHAIAKELDRSKDTISRKAAAMKPPLVWDRTNTVAATQAKVADAKTRRADLQLGLLEDAERMRAQLWSPTMAFNFGGKDNTYEEHPLDQPTFADQLKIMQTVGIAVDRSLKLDVHDSATGSAAVIGLLQQTAHALGITDDTDTAPPVE